MENSNEIRIAMSSWIKSNRVGEAESILNSALMNPNCIIYLTNPDGTQVKLQRGLRLSFCELMTLDEEE